MLAIASVRGAQCSSRTALITQILLLSDLHRMAARWLRRSSKGDVLGSSPLLAAPFRPRARASSIPDSWSAVPAVRQNRAHAERKRHEPRASAFSLWSRAAYGESIFTTADPLTAKINAAMPLPLILTTRQDDNAASRCAALSDFHSQYLAVGLVGLNVRRIMRRLSRTSARAKETRSV